MPNKTVRAVAFITKVTALLSSLWVVEMIISGPIYWIEALIREVCGVISDKSVDWNDVIYAQFHQYTFNKMLRDTFSANIIRLLFCYPFYFPLLIYRFNPFLSTSNVYAQLRYVVMTRFGRLSRGNRVLEMGIINSGFYVLISILYGFILLPDPKSYFVLLVLPTWVITTFLSPFILCKIPFYKRLMYGLMDGADLNEAREKELHEE